MSRGPLAGTPTQGLADPQGHRAPGLPGPGSFVEIRLKTPPSSHWMTQLGERFQARTRVLLCRPTGPGEAKMIRILEIGAEPGKMPAIVRFIRRAAPKGAVTFSARAPHHLLVWAVEPMPAACAAVFHVGAVCTACPLSNDGFGSEEEVRHQWSLLLPRMSPRARGLLKVFDPRDGTAAILRVGGLAPETELTTRQERAVETAFRMGYFDHPRKAGLAEVAKVLGVSRSTTLELLRRGLTKVLSRREDARMLGFGGR